MGIDQGAAQPTETGRQTHRYLLGAVKEFCDSGLVARLRQFEGALLVAPGNQVRVGPVIDQEFDGPYIALAAERWIFDAATFTEGPVAKIRLPERIASGTHSTRVPAGDL